MNGYPELGRLYDGHAEAVFRFLLFFTRDEADAKDILQELFRNLAEKPQRLAGVEDERGFLLRLARNLAVDAIRRADVRRRARDRMAAEPAALFSAAADPDVRLFREALERALALLPPEQRGVVQLKLWEGLTFEQIAAVFSIPPNTAASRYRYGLDKLRDELRPLYEEMK
mgnify:CR=1 FL=1